MRTYPLENIDKQTVVRRSSEASVNTDFELIEVDVWRRKTDWKDGVSVADWTRETQKTDIIQVNTTSVIWMWNDV